MNLGNKQIELKNTVKLPKNFKYFSLFLEFNPIKNLPKQKKNKEKEVTLKMFKMFSSGVNIKK